MASVATPKALIEFLSTLGVKPKKSLSQNFLIDKNIIKNIAKAACLERDDTILEIGAGPGALTEELLKSGAHVIAVEKDRLYAKELHRFEGLEVFEGDIRDFPFSRLVSEKKTKVVANLPYHLTSKILGLLLPRSDLFSTLTLMVQKEVAHRMMAKTKTPDYSPLSLFIDFFSKPTYNFTVSRNCFFPVPNVDSSVLTLDLRKPCEGFDEASFFSFIRVGFQQKRKMLRGSMKSLYSASLIEKSLEEIGSFKEARPEDLSLEKWMEFFEVLRREDGIDF